MSVVKGRNSDGRQNRLRYRFASLRAIRPQWQYEDYFSRFISKRNPISTSIVGPIFVVVVCDATGGAGMHRSETEGRFGEAEPEGRASVCVEPALQTVGVPTPLPTRHSTPMARKDGSRNQAKHERPDCGKLSCRHRDAEDMVHLPHASARQSQGI